MPPLFLAGGHDGLLLTSADGRAWKPGPAGKEGQTYRVGAAGNGRAVLAGGFGGDNLFAATADGTNWDFSKHAANYSQYVRGLGFGRGEFLALGGDPGSVGVGKPFALTSADGEKWAGPHPISGKFILRRAAWGNDRFVAVGDRGRRAASADGRSWDDAPEAKAIDTLVDVAYGNGAFVGVGLHGLRMRTADGKRWTDAARGDEGEHLNSVVWAGDRFVAVGPAATFTSRDGAKWERTPAKGDAPLTAVYGLGVFVGPRWKGRIMLSKDGAAWEEVHRAAGHLEAVAVRE